MSVLLNMDPGAPPVVVTASEGDVGRIFTFQLIKDGMPCSYPSATVTAEILKSDGHGTSIPCTWSGSEVMMVTTEQSTIRAGKANCELRIVSDSYNIGTANFILAVEPRPINADTDQTDSSYSQTGDPGDVWTLGSNGVPSWAPSGLDASSATAGQVLTADGAGGHYWGDIEAGGSVPTEVRQAISALLLVATYKETGLTDEKAIIQSWATEVTVISLSRTTLAFANSTPQTLTATTTPAGGTVSWSSSDTSIATVSGGVVTPVSNGVCTITASAGDKSATCSVTVTAFVSLESITATYSGGSVYESASLDDLRSNLSVRALYDDDSSLIVSSDAYTLSGTLAEGTCPITVSYQGKTATFNVTVIQQWTYSINDLTVVTGPLGNSTGADCGMALMRKATSGATNPYRRSFVTEYGETSIALTHTNSDNIESQTSDYFPIKVPRGATSASVSITPSTQFVQFLTRQLNDGVYSAYATVGQNGYVEGLLAKTFESAPDNVYIFVSSKYNSAGTSYPDEPTGLDVTFS